MSAFSQCIFGATILLSLCISTATQAQTALSQQTLLLNSNATTVNSGSGHAATTPLLRQSGPQW
ncbi:MAG: hypothetical protein ACUVRV_02365 [Cyanobacteriota bacterium]